MEFTLNVKGIDKLQLLHALWDNQKPASFFRTGLLPTPEFDKKDAEFLLTRGYIDYCCGRAIKMNLKSDEIDPTLYDRDAIMPAVYVVKALRTRSEESMKSEVKR